MPSSTSEKMTVAEEGGPPAGGLVGPAKMHASPIPLDFNAALSTRYAAVNRSTAGEAERASADGESVPRPKVRRIRQPPDAAKAGGPSSSAAKAEVPTLRYADLGGIQGILDEIRDLVERPFRYPQIYQHLGVESARGVLLHGPPGCGKTCLAMAIAGELSIPLIKVSAPELVSGMSGESEGRIRDLFEEARAAAPCILFLDEIDAITPKRETAQREMERRIVAQLLTCMDDLGRSQALVIVIGATNRPDSLDPALRRAGRFDRELKMAIPTEEGRLSILRVICASLRLSGSLDLADLARNTPGFVGADLRALAQEAASSAIRRIFAILEKHEGGAPSTALYPLPSASPMDLFAVASGEPAETSPGLPSGEDVEMAPLVVVATENGPPADVTQVGSSEASVGGALPDPISAGEEPAMAASDAADKRLAQIIAESAIEAQDFTVALTKIQPSAKREGFAVVPGTKWSDVGALSTIREELRMAVVEPIRRPHLFSSVGIEAPAGVLLWGPPGCGKTLLAKAVANESHSNFISIKGPELLNKYVGESERAVRQVFERARHSAPCVIFFDELDAICPRRSDDSDASSRVVNQLLTEMDGLEGRRQVFILAATNRPDMIDPAMLRPGRLDKLLYVNLPTPSDRFEILCAISRRTPWASDVDLCAVARDERCAGFTGADLAALVREASLLSVREAIALEPSPAGLQDGSGSPLAMEEDHDSAPNASSPTTSIDACRPDNSSTSNGTVRLTVSMAHLQSALDRVCPSVSAKDLLAYELLNTSRHQNVNPQA